MASSFNSSNSSLYSNRYEITTNLSRAKKSLYQHLSHYTRANFCWPKRYFLVIVMFVALFLPISVTVQDDRATVRVDGRSVFRVSAVENVDVTTRARQIERRINRLLENPTAIAALHRLTRMKLMQFGRVRTRLLPMPVDRWTRSPSVFSIGKH